MSFLDVKCQRDKFEGNPRTSPWSLSFGSSLTNEWVQVQQKDLAPKKGGTLILLNHVWVSAFLKSEFVPIFSSSCWNFIPNFLVRAMSFVRIYGTTIISGEWCRGIKSKRCLERFTTQRKPIPMKQWPCRREAAAVDTHQVISFLCVSLLILNLRQNMNTQCNENNLCFSLCKFNFSSGQKWRFDSDSLGCGMPLTFARKCFWGLLFS